MKGRLFLTMAGLAMIIFILAVGLGGCGSCAEKIAEKAAEKAIESEGGQGDVDINKDEGTIKISAEGKDGGALSFGENVAIPDNWPKEMEIYGGAKAVMVMVSEEGAFGTFQVKASVDEISGFYEKLFSGGGWTQTGTVSTPLGKTITYEKSGINCAVTVSPATSAEEPTTFTLTYSKE